MEAGLWRRIRLRNPHGDELDTKEQPYGREDHAAQAPRKVPEAPPPGVILS